MKKPLTTLEKKICKLLKPGNEQRTLRLTLQNKMYQKKEYGQPQANKLDTLHKKYKSLENHTLLLI